MLGGFVVSAILPPLYQWGDTYHWSKKGLDEVTGGTWESSVIAVGGWLLLLTAWHLARAPLGHAREVLAAHERHHMDEMARLRAEKPAPVVHDNRQYHFNFGENPDPVAIATVLKDGIDAKPLLQIDAAGEMPTVDEPGRMGPEQRQDAQAEAGQVDDVDDGPGDVERGR